MQVPTGGLAALFRYVMIGKTSLLVKIIEACQVVADIAPKLGDITHPAHSHRTTEPNHIGKESPCVLGF